MGDAVSISEELRAPEPPPSPGAHDAALVAQVYESECGYVWNNLRRLGVHERDLEDVVHEVFLVFYRRLAAFDTARPVRPWLYGICARVASDYRGSARYRREVLEAEPPEPWDSPPLPDENLAQKRERALVMAALDALEMNARIVFVMHDIAGHTIAEAASSLDLPMSTLYSRLRVARKQFEVAVKRIRRQQEMPAKGAQHG